MHESNRELIAAVDRYFWPPCSCRGVVEVMSLIVALRFAHVR